MKPSELLNSPEKWSKGSESVTWDKDCIATAIYRSGLTQTEQSEAIQKLKKHLGLDMQYHHIPLWEWNDAPERTFEEVRNALIACGL